MLVRITTLVCALFIAVTLQAKEFSENKHYEVLDNPASTTPEIIEYFSSIAWPVTVLSLSQKNLPLPFPTHLRSHTPQG